MKVFFKKFFWKFYSKNKNQYPFILKDINLTHEITNKHVLILFKTYPLFLFPSYGEKHTNEYEIYLLVKVFNKCGFLVDLIDREFEGQITLKTYDLFFGISAGKNGGPFNRIAKELHNTKKVLMCFGPNPSLSNKKIQVRYLNFNRRFKLKNSLNKKIKPLRLKDADSFNLSVSLSDFLYVIGTNNSFSTNSYKHFGKKIINYKPCIPKKFKTLNTKYELNRFVCFCGEGFIVKGVDVVIEAFLNNPQLHLEIYGPKTDELFWKYYGGIIHKTPNIEYKGFINVGGNKFKSMCSRTAFQVFMSCSEGMATSVLFCMRHGIVPIISHETSLDVKDFGFTIDEIDDKKMISKLSDTIDFASKMDKKEYENRRFKTIEYTSRFSESNYEENTIDTIQKIMQKI